jgi:Uma2 family endonuclease
MSAIASPKELLTPKDLLGLPDLGRYEVLIDGKLKERNASVISSNTAFEINGAVGSYLQATGLGWGFQSDCGLQIFPWAPGKVRFADGGFYRKDRGPRPGHGHLTFAPDLVLEVVSPGDGAEEVEAKVAEYLRAGVSMVWVAYPLTRHILVFTANKEAQRLGPEDELAGGDVLPGFAVAVKDLFLPVED